MDSIEMKCETCGQRIFKADRQTLVDGHSFGTVSLPLPSDHWIYERNEYRYDAPFKIGTEHSERRERWAKMIRQAAMYAIRGATMSGKEMDFDPDAMVQNMIVGLIGCWTPDGRFGE